MKRIIIPLLISLTIIMSCKKDNSKNGSTNIELASPKGVNFFESEATMASEVKTVIDKDFGELRSFTIKKVEYFEDKTKSLALVTYEANGKEHANIAFLVSGEQKATFKCTATDCLCRLDVSQDSEGQYVYECGGCNTNCHFEVSQN